MTAPPRPRRVAAVLAFASIGVATSCSTPSIDDASPAEAAGAIEGAEVSVASIAAESTAPTETPALPPLDELLAQDRFVPLGVALERSDLDDVIDELDDFVLLAPTGTAFASSGADVGIEFSVLMNDTRLLEAIMRYHVVAGASENQSWRTLNGSALEVDGSDADTVEFVDGVEVLDRIPVQNGMVLVMPRLLLPASAPIGTSSDPSQLP